MCFLCVLNKSLVILNLRFFKIQSIDAKSRRGSLFKSKNCYSEKYIYNVRKGILRKDFMNSVFAAAISATGEIMEEVTVISSYLIKSLKNDKAIECFPLLRVLLSTPVAERAGCS